MKDQSLRVLMVEDSENDELLIIRELRKGGYNPVYERVETAAAMQKALQETQWDIILCDYQMPNFSGPSAISLLKETNIDIPLIIVTGTVGEEIAADCMRLGAQDYIMKGNLSRLCPAIARELEDAKIRNKQKDTDEALRKASLDWQVTFDATSDAICLLDPDQRILRCNRTMTEMFGMKQEELIGRRCWEIVHGTMEPIPECPVTRMKSSLVREKMDLKRGNRWLSVTADPILDETLTIQGVVHIVRDITERKKAAEALHESEYRYKSLIENIPDIIFTIDLEGKITFVSKRTKEILGYENTETINRNLFNFIPEEDHQRALENLQKGMKGEKIKHFQIPMIAKSGEKLVFECSFSRIYKDGAVVGAQGTAVDITERKKSEESVRESEAKYRLLFDEMISGYAVHEIICDQTGKPVDYRFLAVNKAFEKMTGLNSTDIIGRTVLEVLPATEPIWIERYGQVALTREPIQFENYSSSMGKYYGVRTFSPEPGKFATIISDITKRKQDESARVASLKALLESEERYKALFDRSLNLIYVMNFDGKFIDANNAALNLFGYKKEEISSINVKSLMDEEQLQLILETIREIKETGIQKGLREIRLRHKDGRDIYVEAQGSIIMSKGKPVAIHVIANDITERKKAEEALFDSQLLLSAVVESTDDFIWSVDPVSFGLLTFNKRLSDNFLNARGLHIQAGMTPEDLFPRSDFVEIWNDLYRRALLEGNYIIEYIGKTGPHIMELNFNLVKRNGIIIAISAFGRDITERKQKEEDLKKYREHLEELVRERTINLEALNKELESFSYSASHDLRAPLRAISGFNQAFLEDYKDKLDIHGKDYLMRIKAATQHMSLLIEDMLKLSRITRTEMNIGKVNLTQIAQSVIDELQNFQPQRYVDVSIADGLEVMADEGLMLILLENLLGNAWKFTEKQAKAVIEFGLTKEDGEKVYFIRDNGAGFDMTNVDKLFTPFQRLHSMEEYLGTGIGLATVQRIINRHRGKVWAEGQKDKGATFYFSLQE